MAGRPLEHYFILSFGVGGNFPVTGYFPEALPFTLSQLLTAMLAWWALGQLVTNLIAWGLQ